MHCMHTGSTRVQTELSPPKTIGKEEKQGEKITDCAGPASQQRVPCIFNANIILKLFFQLIANSTGDDQNTSSPLQ